MAKTKVRNKTPKIVTQLFPKPELGEVPIRGLMAHLSVIEEEEVLAAVAHVGIEIQVLSISLQDNYGNNVVGRITLKNPCLIPFQDFKWDHVAGGEEMWEVSPDMKGVGHE